MNFCRTLFSRFSLSPFSIPFRTLPLHPSCKFIALNYAENQDKMEFIEYRVTLDTCTVVAISATMAKRFEKYQAAPCIETI